MLLDSNAPSDAPTISSPEWLAYASPLIAVAALVVAVLALVTNWRALKLGGPGVRVAVSEGPFTADWRNVTVRVTVTNRGRGPIDVSGFTLLPDKTLRVYPQFTAPAGGPAVPYRLEPSSSRTWELNPEVLLTVYEVLSGHSHYPAEPGRESRRVSKRRIRRFRGQVLLGDGRKVTVKDKKVLDLAALQDQMNRLRLMGRPHR